MMRALCLTQPWASLMALGLKRNETRSKPLAFNGDIAICATKEIWKQAVPEYAAEALQVMWEHRELFQKAYGYASNVRDLYFNLPFGQVVCVVTKTGCVACSDDNGDDRSLTPLELRLGGYSRGRFYYPTNNLRRLESPVKVNGKQGVFFLPEDIELKVIGQI